MGIWGASSALDRTLVVLTVEHWDGRGVTRQREKCDERWAWGKKEVKVVNN